MPLRSIECEIHRVAFKVASDVEIVMLEMLDCIQSKRATRPVYI
jgi:hypothetical protein